MIRITDYREPITLTTYDWNKIIEAVEYLENGTLAELEMVAESFSRKSKATQELFWNEFWAMIGYKAYEETKGDK